MMFGVVQKYITIGALTAALSASGYAMLQKTKAAKLAADNVALAAKLVTCSARAENINEGMQSNAEVDALSNDDLRHVPDRWMRKPR